MKSGQRSNVKNDVSNVFGALKSFIIDPFLRWLYPAHCLVCDLPIFDYSRFVCDLCWSRIPVPDSSGHDPLWLVRHTKTKIYFDSFYACFIFNDQMKKIIHSLKYEKVTGLAKEIIEFVNPDLLNKSDIFASDWIIPIPLYKKKLKSRGYNQATLLSIELAKYLNIKILDDVIRRNRNTLSQTKIAAENRQKNVADAFRVINNTAIKSSKLLLVDDLITTGATVNECAKTLIAAGAKKVSVLAIARPSLKHLV